MNGLNTVRRMAAALLCVMLLAGCSSREDPAQDAAAGAGAETAGVMENATAAFEESAGVPEAPGAGSDVNSAAAEAAGAAAARETAEGALPGTAVTGTGEAAGVMPAGADAPSPEPEEAPGPIGPGNYGWSSEEYGRWQLALKESGLFSLMHDGSIYSGEGWADNGDGTVSLGGTDAAGKAPFFDEFGSSVWIIRGQECEPVF